MSRVNQPVIVVSEHRSIDEVAYCRPRRYLSNFRPVYFVLRTHLSFSPSPPPPSLRPNLRKHLYTQPRDPDYRDNLKNAGSGLA